MKILQIITITAIAALFLALTSCDTDGQIALKDPMPEPSEIHQGKSWNVSDGFPDAGKDEE